LFFPCRFFRAVFVVLFFFVLCFPQDCFYGLISIGAAGLAAQTLEQQGARAVLFLSEEMHKVENQNGFLKSYFAKKTR
jgi:hypothetical protein